MPTIKFTSEGEGLPVIFIHGFCETKDMWYPFVRPLVQDYRVLCVDLPGFGASPLPNHKLTLENVADELAEWMSHEGLEKAVFIGHSLGGYVALALAERHPQLIQGLGLFHSMAYGDDEESKHKRDKALLFLKKHPVAKFIEPFIPSLFHTDRKEELREEIQRSTKIGLESRLQTIIAYTLAMRERKDRFDVWQSIQVPCLFIGGTDDTRIPADMAEAHIEARDEVDGYILPETAHMGMFERPTETLQMIQDYLLKID